MEKDKSDSMLHTFLKKLSDKLDKILFLFYRSMMKNNLCRNGNNSFWKSNKIFTKTNDLIPSDHLQKCVRHYQWAAQSDDPQFLLQRSFTWNLKPGFYRVTVNLNLDHNRDVASIYPDYGNGFCESDVIKIPIFKNCKANRILYIPRHLFKLRFDPICRPRLFTINEFSIESIDKEVAITEIQSKLIDGKHDSEFTDVNLLYHQYNLQFNEDPNKTSYRDWIEFVEKPLDPSQPDVLHLLNDPNKPLFSIIMPTFNSNIEFLRKCIQSVLDQSYTHFEFCIADDRSTDIQVSAVLKEYEVSDKRIKVVFREQNGHISRATNTAIDLASGDFLVLLDHDDLLAKHALYFMAEAILLHPDGKVFYSDEDKIDEFDLRTDPHFKCDWNPDLFYSQNYVSHLGVYKTDLVKQIGGFRTEVVGAQDYDLLLRCLPLITPKQIIHVPKILYHWRMVLGSTALGHGEKNYTTKNGVVALQDFFAHNGPKGLTVQGSVLPNTYRINWPLPEREPKVSLLIPTRDKRELIEVAVRSILEKTIYKNYEIVILDNGSTDILTLEFFETIQKLDTRVRVIRYDLPFNYSAINNYGVSHTSGDIIGLINNDIEVINPTWLSEMVSHVIRPDIGCVGAKLYYRDDTIQHAGVVLGIGGVAGHGHKGFVRNSYGYFSRLMVVHNVSAVTAAVLLVRRDIYLQVNGLDEKDLTIAFNDVDFCLKVRMAGYRNIWTPFAELYHYESVSRGLEDTPEKVLRFNNEVDHMIKKWGKVLESDPYYNPNLTKNHTDFSIDVG